MVLFFFLRPRRPTFKVSFVHCLNHDLIGQSDALLSICPRAVLPLDPDEQKSQAVVLCYIYLIFTTVPRVEGFI